MPDIPLFQKSDRYKVSSYRAYNFKLPDRYDSSFWMSFCQTKLWDDAVQAELGVEVRSLRILDVGCATGRLLSSLAQAGAENLAGVDLAPRILDVARRKLADRRVEVDLRAADAEDALPWPSESFDLATLTGVLHHFYRPHDALQEVHRVLRTGGRLLVIDPDFFPPLRQFLNLALRVAPHWGDFRFYSRCNAIQLLENVGLGHLRSRRIGLWSYLITAVKASESLRP
ncbi:MAG: methyltransferase domain-containing protein [Phycisphaerae bacterium]